MRQGYLASALLEMTQRGKKTVNPINFPSYTLNLLTEMNKVLKVLFVCYGNICRSPMAEYYFRSILGDHGLDSLVTVSSAATSAEEIGNPVYPPVKKLLASHGISSAEKTARQITQADYEAYDLIIGMDSENLNALRRVYGKDPKKKLSLLLDWTGDPRDIDDPWYTRNFSACWNDIVRGCDALASALEKRLST